MASSGLGLVNSLSRSSFIVFKSKVLDAPTYVLSPRYLSRLARCPQRIRASPPRGPDKPLPSGGCRSPRSHSPFSRKDKLIAAASKKNSHAGGGVIARLSRH